MAEKHSWEQYLWRIVSNIGPKGPIRDWVKCRKCGYEVPRHQAKRGTNPCEGKRKK